MIKNIKIVSYILGFILIIVILWFTNGFLGNPISKTLANNVAQKYIKNNYSNLDVNISRVYYSFKDGYYYVDLKSPTSKDTHFTVSISPFGKIEYDSYDEMVLKKYNTYTRIDELYNLKVKKVFEDENFLYKTDIYFGEVKIMSLENEDSEFGPIYGIDISKLELDKDYDINEIGKKYGHIVLYIEDKDISLERTSDILIDVKSILDEKNISFYVIDFTLQEHKQNEQDDSKTISIQQFLYDDIYKKDLNERLEKACNELQNYYDEQDKIKRELENN